jgi:hypothetical protein
MANLVVVEEYYLANIMSFRLALNEPKTLKISSQNFYVSGCSFAIFNHLTKQAKVLI